MALLKQNFFKKAQTPLAALTQRFDDAMKLEDRLDTLFLMKGISNDAQKAQSYCSGQGSYGQKVKGYPAKQHDQFADLYVKAVALNQVLQQEVTADEVLKSKRLPDFLSFYVDGAGTLRNRIYGEVFKARMPAHDGSQLVGHWKIKIK